MKEKVEKKKLAIKGMHCRSCEMLITDSVKEISGVKTFKVDYKNGMAEAEYDPRKTGFKEIIRVVKEQGYECKAVI